jgi:hypothetical protein
MIDKKEKRGNVKRTLKYFIHNGIVLRFTPFTFQTLNKKEVSFIFILIFN